MKNTTVISDAIKVHDELQELRIDVIYLTRLAKKKFNLHFSILLLFEIMTVFFLLGR